ncbi:MAG: PaaX family transcriptional regulator C-terminal domain-containing protein [Oleibacter sp.]|nr:PaaX family transcriptional regulator C-terminal domain-containing protein [Thalassolituus sp.]
MSVRALPHSAKKLILNLVKEADQPISAISLVRIGGLFELEPNNIRVTLNRLVSQGLLILSDQGGYVLGEEAQVLAHQQKQWQLLEQGLKPWKGDWIAIYVANLGRRDRKQLRKRERVTTLWGFRQFDQGLLIRPDNLKIELASLRQNLIELGLESEVCIFRVSEFQCDKQPSELALWPVQKLNDNYLALTAEMQSWLASYAEKNLQDAARESFLIGNKVLHDIAYDPRLPQEMIDSARRQQMVETMIHFNAVGRAIWAELIAKVGQD